MKSWLDYVPGEAVLEEYGEVAEAQGCLTRQVGFDLQISVLEEVRGEGSEFLQYRGRRVFGRYRGEFEYIQLHGLSGFIWLILVADIHATH
jgi:hypothetical protein